MTIIRSVAAIVAGFWFMASTLVVGTIIATALFVPGGPGGLASVAGGAVPATPPIGYLAANLIVRVLGAVLGGWLTARIAAHAPLAHAIVLAAIVAAISVVTAMNAPQLGRYSVVISAIGVIGVLLGGWLRASAAAPAAQEPA